MSYYVALPDGRYVEVPDDVPQSVARERILESFPEFAPRAQVEEIAKPSDLNILQHLGKSFGSGVDTLQASLYSATEGVGRGVGSEWLERTGREGRERNQREAEEALPAKYRQSFNDAESFGDYARATAQALGQSVPSMLPAAAGALAGSMVAPGPGTVAGFMAGVAGGTAAGSIPFYGSNRIAQMEASPDGQVQSEAAAALTAPVQAGLDSVSTVLTMGLAGIFKVPAQLVATRLLPRIASGIGLGAVSEIPTEVGQQVLERAQAGKDIFSEDAFKEYSEVAKAAGAVGGLMGGAGAAVGGGKKGKAPSGRGEDEELRGALGDYVAGQERDFAQFDAAQAEEQRAALEQQRANLVRQFYPTVSDEQFEAAPQDVQDTLMSRAMRRAFEEGTLDPDQLLNMNRDREILTKDDIVALIEQRERRAAEARDADVAAQNAQTDAQPEGAAFRAEGRTPEQAEFFRARAEEIYQEARQRQDEERRDARLRQDEERRVAAQQRAEELLSATRDTTVAPEASSVDQTVEAAQETRAQAEPQSAFHPVVAGYIQDFAASQPGQAISIPALQVYVAETTGQRISLADTRAILQDFTMAPKGQPGFVLKQTRDGRYVPVNPGGERVDANTSETTPAGIKSIIANRLASSNRTEFSAARDEAQTQTGEQTETDAQTETEAQAEPQSPAATAMPEAYGRAQKIVQARLTALAGRGEQGKRLRTSLENLLSQRGVDDMTLYKAFRAADIISTLLPQGATHNVDFVREAIKVTNPEAFQESGGREGQAPLGARTAPTGEVDRGKVAEAIRAGADPVQAYGAQARAATDGLIQLATDPGALMAMEQTAAHEAFHVLQDYYAKYDPEFAAFLARAFKDGMTVADIDASIRRKLETTTVSPTSRESYWDQLTSTLGEEKYSAREMQAYVFGALLDANRRGVPMTGIRPAVARFINFLRDFGQKFGSALRGDGFRNVETALSQVAEKGERRFDGAAVPTDQDVGRGEKGAAEYSARHPTTEYSAAPLSVEEKIHGIATNKPTLFSRAMRSLTGAKMTSIYGDGLQMEKNSDAFIRGSINRAHPFHILAKTLERGGMPQFKDLGRIVETALNNAGRVEATVMFGPPVYDPKTGDVTTHQTAPGLLDIYGTRVRPSEEKPLQRYYVALRERDLRKQGRIGFTNLTDAEIQGIIRDAEANHPNWIEASKLQDQFNKALLDLMVQTGVLARKQADAMGSLFHTPFYRLMDEDNDANPNRVIGPSASDTLNNPSKFLKKLEGGDQPIGGLFENLLRNADAITRAAMKNVAMQQSVAAMEAAGLARPVTPSENTKGEHVLTFKRDGNTTTYAIDDPVLYTAIAGLPARQRTGLEKAVIGFGGFFRDMITAAPSFMLANLWRGKVVAYVQEGLPFHTNTFDGIKKALNGSSSLQRIMTETGFGGFDFGMSPRDNAAAFERKLRLKQGEATAWDRVRGVMDGLLRMSEATEMAERIKLYERLVGQGMDERNAAYQAYLLAPFSRRGTGEGLAGETLSWLTPMVPFLNAKMQSLYRVVENEKGDKRSLATLGLPKQIFLRGLLLTAFSAAAFAWSSGDDRWDEETVDRKMMYDIIYMGDKAIYIPRAFEFGSIFGTLPVFALDAIRRQDGSDLAKMVSSVGTSTFFFNPIPPAIQPILNVMFNYDMFRGRELETKGEQAMPAAERSNRFTTGGAELLAGAVNNTLGQMPRGARVELSPIKAQALLDGYLGSTGTILLNAADSMASMMGLRKAKPADAFGDPGTPMGLAATLSGVKRFVKSDDERVTRFVGDFYTIKQEVDGVVRLFNDAKGARDTAKIQEIMSESRSSLAVAPALNQIGRKIGELNRQMKLIERQGGDPETMAERLTPLRQARNQLARRGVELAKERGAY